MGAAHKAVDLRRPAGAGIAQEDIQLRQGAADDVIHARAHLAPATPLRSLDWFTAPLHVPDLPAHPSPSFPAT
jgi:hypothetical protein